MSTITEAEAIEKVLSGQASLTASAKMAGMQAVNLRYRIMRNPKHAAAYKALQESNPDRRPFNVEKLDREAMKQHPAVVDVVENKMTYAAAAEKHNLHTQTLYGWVKRIYKSPPKRNGQWLEQARTNPDQLQIEAVEPRPATSPLETDKAKAALDILMASTQATANLLGVTPTQVLAKLLEQAPTQAQAPAPAKPVAPDNSL